MVNLNSKDARYLVDGYSIYDSQTFIRFDNTMSKITKENIIDVTSLVKNSKEPEIVKRTSLNLFKKYVISSKKNRGRVMIRDKHLFFKTITYYSRIINGFPAIKPPKLHKGFKEFMLTYMNSHPEVKKVFMKNRYDPQNLIYSTLLQTVVSKHTDLELHAYRLSLTLGKLFKNHGYFTTKPQISVAVFVLFIAKKHNYPAPVKKISKMFMTSDAYLVVLAKKQQEKLEAMWQSLPEEDKKLVIDSIKIMLERIKTQ